MILGHGGASALGGSADSHAPGVIGHRKNIIAFVYAHLLNFYNDSGLPIPSLRYESFVQTNSQV